MESLRLFVGKLSKKVDENNLKEKFEKYGKITKITLKENKDLEENLIDKFAFINIESERNRLHECK